MKITQYIQAKEWRTIEMFRVLAEGRTQKQSYCIAELAHYGKTLLLNGCIQSTEKDECYYHEALLFPALMLHGKVKNIICFGGANGGVLKRLALVSGIEKVIQIDIDEELYVLSRQHLPHMHPDIPIPFQLQLHFIDPIDWLQKNRKDFLSWADLIICDLPDATAESYATILFTKSFYADVKSLLAPAGIFVTQSGQAHVFDMQFHQRVIATLRQSFSYVESYAHFIPSYGVPWAFALACRKNFLQVAGNKLQKRIERLPEDKIATYDFITHQHMFHLPKHLRKSLLNTAQEPITSKNLAHVQIVKDKE